MVFQNLNFTFCASDELSYPGKVISEEIEAESGGSGIRYSFVISNKKAQHEVGVDAKTGALLENSVDGHNPD